MTMYIFVQLQSESLHNFSVAYSWKVKYLAYEKNDCMLCSMVETKFSIQARGIDNNDIDYI